MPLPGQGGGAVSMDNLDEHVPLVSTQSHSFTLNSIRQNEDGDAIYVGDDNGDELDLAFRSVGVDILVRDVTLLSSRAWSVATRGSPTIICQSVSAVWGNGKLHAVVATDPDAFTGLFLAVTRREVPAAGDVRFNTLAAITDQCFGFVGRDSVVVPNLTVTENLEFAINLLTRARPEWKREMIAITTSFVKLDRHQKAQDLNAEGVFRLKLAMELVRDPSIVFLAEPFDGMSDASETAAVAVLRDVAHRLHKTVIVGACTAPFHVLDASDTTVLLGRGGRTLYSGMTRGVCPYFNQLHIRAAHMGQNTTSASAADTTTNPRDGTPTVTVTAVAAAAASPSPSPYRISSPLPLFNDGSPAVVSSRRHRNRDHAAVDEDEDEDAVRLALPSTAVDLATEWAESEPQTMLYAAKFYDSRQHMDLLEGMSRLQVGPGSLTSDPVATSLPAQTTARKLFVLLHHQLRAARTSPEAQTALAHLVGGLSGLLMLVLQLPSRDFGGAFNVRGILFVIVTLPLLANHRYVGVLKDQLEVFLHHRRCGMYGTAVFLTTLVLRVAAECVLHTIALATFSIWLVPQAPVSLGVVAGLGGLTHRLLLYVNASVLPSWLSENRPALVYLAYSSLSCGFLLNLTTFPRWMSWGSILRWGFAGAVKEETAGHLVVCDGPSNTWYCHNREEYIAVQGVTDDSLRRSAWILVTMGVLCVIALGCSLSVRV